MAPQKRVLLVFSDDDTIHLLEQNILAPDGYQVAATRTCQEAEKAVRTIRPDLLVLGDNLSDGNFLELAARLRKSQPTLPILLFTQQPYESFPNEAIGLGLVDWLTPPLNADEVREAIKRGLKRSQDWQDWLEAESQRHTGPLLQRLDDLESLAKVGRMVTAHLDLDKVLTAVVDAAVQLCNAEEGSIMLIDESSGELYMRAAKNFGEEFVKTFRLAVNDSLVSEVIQNGQPIFIDYQDPQKIKTEYLVSALIYVPLIVHNRTIGVLGVDNRESGNSFEKKHLTLMSAMADFAAIAIENARLYSETDLERNKLERILTQIEDGVIIIDTNKNLVLINHKVRKAFNLGDEDFIGKPLDEVITNEELLMAIDGSSFDLERLEVHVTNSEVYAVQVTEIEDVGMVATLHDISDLKELDHLKSDFVNTVSHDLRSPLTAIMGYVELIKRVGEVNEQQDEYIDLVQVSVRSITDLVNDLLNLGKIEVGLKDDLETISLVEIVESSLKEIKMQAAVRKQELKKTIGADIPMVNGNPIQLRQMVDNLISNAIKYSPDGGEIDVTIVAEDGQIIFSVVDDGPGVPSEEHSKIFERFYRSKNVSSKAPGTGLGLAITKSIVDNHHGRIWVESPPSGGAVFTVVLPSTESENGSSENISE